LEVDVQTATVFLDPSANPELNRRLLASTPIRFISNEEGVRVQFQASRIESTTFQGRPALRIALPASLHKVQRREYYRMPTPIMNPVKCMIPVAGDETLEMPLTDISLGGLCLAGEFGSAPPALGTVLEGCRIQLGTAGALRIDLYVRNTYLVTLRNGSYSRRTGCQFLAITPQQEALVQRYVILLEQQQRRAKSG
ncbi:MAG: flagellar brake protein, partial [Burkholderiales bacterium]|nr:flagellar brake protein [Burkholderiales bacterium]